MDPVGFEGQQSLQSNGIMVDLYVNGRWDKKCYKVVPISSDKQGPITSFIRVKSKKSETFLFSAIYRGSE